LKREGGPFTDGGYGRLGGVGVLTVEVDTPFQGVGYRFALFENPHALPKVAVPPDVIRGYARYTNTGLVA